MLLKSAAHSFQPLDMFNTFDGGTLSPAMREEFAALSRCSYHMVVTEPREACQALVQLLNQTATKKGRMTCYKGNNTQPVSFLHFCHPTHYITILYYFAN